MLHCKTGHTTMTNLFFLQTIDRAALALINTLVVIGLPIVAISFLAYSL